MKKLVSEMRNHYIIPYLQRDKELIQRTSERGCVKEKRLMPGKKMRTVFEETVITLGYIC